MRRRRQSPLPIIAAVVLAVALAVSLLANWSLVKTGEFTLPGFSEPILAAAPAQEEEEQPRPDLETVFVPARDLPAFHQVTMNDFYRADGTLSILRLPKETVSATTSFVSPNQSIGLVLRRPKSKNQAFHPSEFFPGGTQPGLSAGVPEGMVGRWVDCDRVAGLEGLATGDVIGLVASSTIEPLLPDDLEDAERVLIEMDFRMKGYDVQAEVRRVVRHGVVVQPPVARVDENGKKVGLQCFLALDPLEATELAAALEEGDRVHAVIQSGRAEAPPVDVDERKAADPMVPVVERPRPAQVEEIRGDQRRTTEVPRAGEAR